MIAVDWGTSSLRAYLLGETGEVLKRREAPLGILSVESGRFAEALESQAGDWIGAGHRPILMSGMIGSRQGWREAPYAQAPAGPAEIAAALVQVHVRPGVTAWIVPGVIVRSEDGVHDVMRGEETQILGVLRDLGPGTHRLCLPGTHSKWVTLVDGRIEGFGTHMTGEVFAVLERHSILGRTMTPASDPDVAAFELGLARSGDSGGLLHHLFGVRAQFLAGVLQGPASRDYLSGLLIGHECRAAGAAGTVHLLGAPSLVRLYERALGRLGCTARALDTDAVTRGLHDIARARRLS